MGPRTKEDIQESLVQVEESQRILKEQTTAKSQQEAAYLEQMILVIQQLEQLPEMNQPVESIIPSSYEERLFQLVQSHWRHLKILSLWDCRCKATVERKNFEEWLRVRQRRTSWVAHLSQMW